MSCLSSTSCALSTTPCDCSLAEKIRTARVSKERLLQLQEKAQLQDQKKNYDAAMHSYVKQVGQWCLTWCGLNARAWGARLSDCQEGERWDAWFPYQAFSSSCLAAVWLSFSTYSGLRNCSTAPPLFLLSPWRFSLAPPTFSLRLQPLNCPALPLPLPYLCPTVSPPSPLWPAGC